MSPSIQVRNKRLGKKYLEVSYSGRQHLPKWSLGQDMEGISQLWGLYTKHKNQKVQSSKIRPSGGKKQSSLIKIALKSKATRPQKLHSRTMTFMLFKAILLLHRKQSHTVKSHHSLSFLIKTVCPAERLPHYYTIQNSKFPFQEHQLFGKSEFKQPPLKHPCQIQSLAEDGKVNSNVIIFRDAVIVNIRFWTKCDMYTFWGDEIFSNARLHICWSATMKMKCS